LFGGVVGVFFGWGDPVHGLIWGERIKARSQQSFRPSFRFPADSCLVSAAFDRLGGFSTCFFSCRPGPFGRNLWGGSGRWHNWHIYGTILPKDINASTPGALMLQETKAHKPHEIPDGRAMGRAGESLKPSVGDTSIGFHMDNGVSLAFVKVQSNSRTIRRRFNSPSAFKAAMQSMPVIRVMIPARSRQASHPQPSPPGAP